jgi:hypothetical protein
MRLKKLGLGDSVVVVSSVPDLPLKSLMVFFECKAGARGYGTRNKCAGSGRSLLKLLLACIGTNVDEDGAL